MANHTGCTLAIVGTREGQRNAVEALTSQIIQEHRPEAFVSGGAPGVDSWAESVAIKAGLPCFIFRPTHTVWDLPMGGTPIVTTNGLRTVINVPGGFRQRNEKIVEACQCLCRLAIENPATYGSGWTADLAQKLNRRVYRYVISRP